MCLVNLGEEQLWEANETKNFKILPSYSNSILNSIELYFPPSLNTAQPSDPTNYSAFNESLTLQNNIRTVIDNISINGFELSYIYNSVANSSSPSATQLNSISYTYIAFKNLVDNGSKDVYKAKNFPVRYFLLDSL